MKRKQKNTSYQRAALKPSAKKHLERLGRSHAQAYFSWCVQRNFADSLDKGNLEREAECRVHQREQMSRKEQSRVHHNPDRLLREACAGRLDPAMLHRPGWREVGEAIARVFAQAGRAVARQLSEVI